MMGFESQPPPEEPAAGERPAAATDAGHQADPIRDDAPPITTEQVRLYLTMAGGMANGAVGREPGHWEFTPGELDMICPAVVSYINRHPRLRAAAAAGDTGTAVMGAVSYLWRNIGTELEHREYEAAAARRAEAEAADDEAWLADAGRRPEASVDLSVLQETSNENADRWPPRPAN